MKLTIVGFVLWLIILVGLTFLFWLKPRSFFASSEGSDMASDSGAFMASVLAILLFLSCFLFGLWIGIAELKGMI